VSTRLGRNCCNLPRDYNAFGLCSKTLAVGTPHITLEGRISDTVTVGKLSGMRICERLPCGTRTECPYVVWLGFTLQGLKSIRIAGCLSDISVAVSRTCLCRINQ